MHRAVWPRPPRSAAHQSGLAETPPRSARGIYWATEAHRTRFGGTTESAAFPPIFRPTLPFGRVSAISPRAGDPRSPLRAVGNSHAGRLSRGFGSGAAWREP